MRKKETVWAVAVHEAGHAVVAATLGVPFLKSGLTLRIRKVVIDGEICHEVDGCVNTKVVNPESLRGDIPEDGPPLKDWALQNLTVKTAGTIAQMVFDAPGGNPEQDMEEIAEYANALAEPCQASPEAILELAQRSATAIIVEKKQAVQTIARLAVAKGVVRPKQIGAILNTEVQVWS